jgi:predicted phage baseplate assembly protein
VLRWSSRLLLPAVTLREQGVSDSWLPKRDLLNSESQDKEFVAESENDGVTYLRFGDDRFGSRPAVGATFFATYRVGNGVRGNVGAEAVAHLVSDDPAIVSDLADPVIIAVSNPLPAQGGSEPETLEQVRQNAPQAFRVQERAVTPADYAAMTQRCDLDVQRAAATLRWTGSWRTVFLTADRIGGAPVDPEFERRLRQCLERYRMAGHDLEIDSPRPVSLEIEMRVCVKPGYFAGDVKAALHDEFSNRLLPDGRRGTFHPDNFTFGQTVYLSPLYATAQALAGVDSVEIRKFQRQGVDSDEALSAGKLELARLEIARLDNDANFPDHGVFNLIMSGGQ